MIMSEYKVSYKAHCIHFVPLSGNGVFPCFTVSNMYGKILIQCSNCHKCATKLVNFADMLMECFQCLAYLACMA